MSSELVNDPDVDLVIDHYKHFFPDFTTHHFQIYKMLWRVEPLPVDTIILGTGLSKSTVYTVLKDLASVGLVNKTNFSPVGYYVPDPLKDYKSNLRQVLKKLEKGAEIMRKLKENSTSLSDELYLVKRDGGQQRLLSKQTRTLLKDTQQLLEIRKVIDEQIREADKQKMKSYAVYK